MYLDMPVVGPGHRQEPLHCDGHHDEDGAAQTQPGQYTSTINSTKNLLFNVLSKALSIYRYKIYFKNTTHDDKIL